MIYIYLIRAKRTFVTNELNNATTNILIIFRTSASEEPLLSDTFDNFLKKIYICSRENF